MKLLITTQKVDKDDAILGFFHRWIEEFSKHCDLVTVICLEEGKHDLPKNVHVYSLGKERGYSKYRYLVRFYMFIMRFARQYDAVFVHMNPEYVVLAGDLWKMMGKKVSLWYTHRENNLKLRLAADIADVIFTASLESFTAKSKKIHVMGHGIDTSRFGGIEPATFSPLVVSHVGRITPIKHLEIIVDVLPKIPQAELELVGGVVTQADRVYKESVIARAEKLGVTNRVKWKGEETNTKAFAGASVTVNAAPDGGMDKAVLESLASGRAAFASNRAFERVFGEYKNLFMYTHLDPEDLAKKIHSFLELHNKEEIIDTLRLRMKTEFDVAILIDKITHILAK